MRRSRRIVLAAAAAACLALPGCLRSVYRGQEVDFEGSVGIVLYGEHGYVTFTQELADRFLASWKAQPHAGIDVREIEVTAKPGKVEWHTAEDKSTWSGPAAAVTKHTAEGAIVRVTGKAAIKADCPTGVLDFSLQLPTALAMAREAGLTPLVMSDNSGIVSVMKGAAVPAAFFDVHATRWTVYSYQNLLILCAAAAALIVVVMLFVR